MSPSDARPPRRPVPALRTGAPSMRVLLGGLLMAVLVAGCDQNAREATGGVTFDLRPLFLSAQDEPCVSVVERLSLTVTESDGSGQVLIREVTADDAEVRIPVSVRTESVRFEAAVLSNNGTLLYSGIQTVEVTRDGFSVSLPVLPVNAVLMACPAPAPFVFTESGFAGEFYLHNRGTREVAWVATPCRLSTFALEVCQGVVEAGSHDLVYGFAFQRSPPVSVDVRVTSSVGSLDVRLTTDVARPPALLAEGVRQRPLPLPSVTLTPWTPSP